MDNEKVMNSVKTTDAVEPLNSENAIDGEKSFIDINKLKPHEKNAKIYGKENVSDLITQIEAYGGIADPIWIKSDGTIISGHRRWQAALSLGMKEIPVKIVEFESEEEELATLVMLNYHRSKTNEQKAREGMILEQVLRTESMERKLKALKQYQTDRVPVSQSDDVQEVSDSTDDTVASDSADAKGRTRDKVAEAVKISSGRSYDRMKKVVTVIDGLRDTGNDDDASFLSNLLNKSVKPACSLVDLGYISLPDEERKQIRDGKKASISLYPSANLINPNLRFLSKKL